MNILQAVKFLEKNKDFRLARCSDQTEELKIPNYYEENATKCLTLSIKALLADDWFVMIKPRIEKDVDDEIEKWRQDAVKE